jgi:hypothetical protein
VPAEDDLVAVERDHFALTEFGFEAQTSHRCIIWHILKDS